MSNSLRRTALTVLSSATRRSGFCSSAIASSSSLQAASSSSSSSSSSSASSSSSHSSPPDSFSPAATLISHLDPSTLPPTLSPVKKIKTLYEHLNALPNNGVGTRVRQTKWVPRGVDVPFSEKLNGPVAPADRKQSGHLCYWEVTKARIRLAGEKKTPHGKVWGRLTWRGVQITPPGKEERIRGGLKYSWDVAK